MDRTPYPAALRLYAIAIDRWAEIDATYYNADLIRFPPHKFLNCVYTWCLARINPEKQEDWIMMLEAPLPGREERPTEAQIEREGADFMAAMAMTKKGK